MCAASWTAVGLGEPLFVLPSPTISPSLDWSQARNLCQRPVTKRVRRASAFVPSRIRYQRPPLRVGSTLGPGIHFLRNRIEARDRVPDNGVVGHDAHDRVSPGIPVAASSGGPTGPTGATLPPPDSTLRRWRCRCQPVWASYVVIGSPPAALSERGKAEVELRLGTHHGLNDIRNSLLELESSSASV